MVRAPLLRFLARQLVPFAVLLLPGRRRRVSAGLAPPAVIGNVYPDRFHRVIDGDLIRTRRRAHNSAPPIQDVAESASGTHAASRPCPGRPFFHRHIRPLLPWAWPPSGFTGTTWCDPAKTSHRSISLRSSACGSYPLMGFGFRTVTCHGSTSCWPSDTSLVPALQRLYGADAWLIRNA